MKKTPGTEPIAPVAPLPQRRVQIERQGASTEAQVGRYPNIRGGVCEFCGVLDGNLPSQDQYKLCPHYRGLGTIRCSYCNESKDPDQVNAHTILRVATLPNDPYTLVAWCDSMECSEAHLKRFRISR